MLVGALNKHDTSDWLETIHTLSCQQMLWPAPAQPGLPQDPAYTNADECYSLSWPDLLSAPTVALPSGRYGLTGEFPKFTYQVHHLTFASECCCHAWHFLPSILSHTAAWPGLASSQPQLLQVSGMF